MKSLSYFDSSYSPNEVCEQNDNYMDCGACYDTGSIGDDVYCDCMHGKARIGHDMEDALIEPMPDDEQLQKLYDNYRAFGEC